MELFLQVIFVIVSCMVLIGCVFDIVWTLPVACFVAVMGVLVALCIEED